MDTYQDRVVEESLDSFEGEKAAFGSDTRSQLADGVGVQQDSDLESI
jgi:hypothetical protein